MRRSETLFKPTHGIWEKSSKCVCVLSERETWSQSFFNVYVITSPAQILSQNIQCLYPLASVTPILFYFINILLRISSNFFCVLRGFPCTTALKYKMHFELLSLNTRKMENLRKTNKQTNKQKKGRKVKWVLMNLLAILFVLYNTCVWEPNRTDHEDYWMLEELKDSSQYNDFVWSSLDDTW